MEKDTFTRIKQEIAKALALYNQNFSKDFFLYTFSSDTSLITMLTQKDELNNERPISFMSESLKISELNYPTMEKQAYAVYKVMKYLRPYLLKTIAFSLCNTQQWYHFFFSKSWVREGKIVW